MLPKTWTQAEFEFVCLLLIFPHSGDSGLPTGGWVGPPWAWGQGVGPARLLDRVTRLCRPACVIERPHISVAAEAFSLGLVSFAREEPSHLPPGRQQLGRWAQGRGTLGLREQAGRDLHSGPHLTVCLPPRPPPSSLGPGDLDPWSVGSVSGKYTLPVSCEGGVAPTVPSLSVCPVSSPTFWGTRHLLQPPRPRKASSVDLAPLTSLCLCEFTPFFFFLLLNKTS